MPIIVRSDRAFNFLERYGMVVSFRADRRARADVKTDVRRGRNESKQFTARVIELGKAQPDKLYMDEDALSLTRFSQLSGFSSRERWVREIEKLNGGVPDEGFLYLIKKVED